MLQAIAVSLIGCSRLPTGVSVSVWVCVIDSSALCECVLTHCFFLPRAHLLLIPFTADIRLVPLRSGEKSHSWVRTALRIPASASSPDGPLSSNRGHRLLVALRSFPPRRHTWHVNTDPQTLERTLPLITRPSDVKKGGRILRLPRKNP